MAHRTELMPDRVFDVFSNADGLVSRAVTERGPDGATQTSSSTVLQCRGDLQMGRQDRSAGEATYRPGDATFFPADGVGDVEVGDMISVTHDSGRAVTGTVAAVEPLSGMIAISTSEE
jgi:hypothetical protein